MGFWRNVYYNQQQFTEKKIVVVKQYYIMQVHEYSQFMTKQNPIKIFGVYVYNMTFTKHN